MSYSFWRRAVLAACMMVGAGATGSAPVSATFELLPDEPTIVLIADYLESDQPTPPPDDAAWSPRGLPDLWHDQRASKGVDRAWYRFSVQRAEVTGPIAIYLWRYSMNARIFFNDELLVDGGSFEEPVARNLHRPLLAVVPNSSWRSGRNWVYVNLRVYPGYGHLLPPAIGPAARLEPAYAKRFFFQIDLSRYLFVVTLLIAVLGLVLWLVNRDNTAYGYFALACLLWSVYSLNPFIQNVPVSMKSWLWVLHVSVDGFALALMLFLHRQHDHTSRPLELGYAAWMTLAAITYAAVPIGLLGKVTALTHIVSTSVSIYLIAFTFQRFRRTGQRDSLFFSVVLTVLFGLAVHDLLLISGRLQNMWVQHFLALNLGAPLVFIAIVAHLTWRLRDNNRLLLAEVARIRGELEQTFEERERLQRQRAVDQERERIYRDLHDDVGARLLSIVYRAKGGELATIARETLADMRAMVSQTSRSSEHFTDVAARWHVETNARCAEAGCVLLWQAEHSAALVRPRVVYQMTRVLRELVTNALKHGRPSELTVTLTASADAIALQVEDDGGPAHIDHTNGIGIPGVQARVAELGGSVEWIPGETGMAVVVSVSSDPETNDG